MEARDEGVSGVAWKMRKRMLALLSGDARFVCMKSTKRDLSREPRLLNNKKRAALDLIQRLFPEDFQGNN